MEQLTGRTPEVIAGKPSSIIMEVAQDRLGLPAEQCIVIGDRLETDIRMGKEAGMYAAVVLTGVTQREDVAQAPFPPDLILNSLAELPAHIL
jgi:ribonucleotide monophosphatase NagD (HAD superfamily)